MMFLAHKGVILKTVLISLPLSKFKESSFPSRGGQASATFRLRRKVATLNDNP